jgi:transcriptional regulator
MYIPDHFKINDTAEIRNFVQEHPFGMLVNNGKQVPGVTHLPMQLLTDDSGKDSINMHLSKANPHTKALENGESAVVVFERCMLIESFPESSVRSCIGK